MGTNYYISINKCNHCGRADDLHIGKQSYGWKFSFQAYPEHNIASFADWKRVIVANGGLVEDEYRRTYTLREFTDMVSSRQSAPNSRMGDSDHYLDGAGYEFTEREFS